MFGEDGEWQPAGKFLPVAERLNLTPQLDLATVAPGLDELEAKPALSGLAINLSASSIQLPKFRQELHALLKRRSGTARLWLEVSETGALAHFEAFLKGLSTIAKGIGLKVIAEGVGNESELAALAGVGFDGATGPAVQEPA